MYHRRIAAAVAALCLAAPASAAATVPPAELEAAVAKGTAWMRSQQNAQTGALSGFGADWAASAFSAAGIHPATLGAPSLQDALLAQWTTPTWTDPTDFAEQGNANWLVATDFERAILHAHAAGLQPARLSADGNLVAQLAGLYHPSGAFGEPALFNGTIFGVLALARTDVPRSVLAKSAELIRTTAHDDGGWTFSLATTPAQKAAPSDIDMTGAALAALCDTGVASTDPVVKGGLAFLRGKLVDATGAFNHRFGVNADSNAWAVQGLNACGIDPQSPEWTTPAGKTPLDFLVSLQRANGSFKYSPGESESQNPNLYATQDAVRALAGGSFTADPPANPGVRPAPAVADGTPVPTVLALDDGLGGIALCRTTAPAGAPLKDVLAAAKAASMPPGCVTELSVDGTTVTSVNGKRGGWLASLDGAPERLAGGQRVGFGDIVALRLQHTPLPAGELDATAPGAFGAQPAGTIGAALTVTFAAREYPVRPTRAVVDGDDFLISGDTCTGETLQPGQTCALRVRFAPAEPGERAGTLRLLGGAAPATVALSGTGTALQAAGVPGPKGDAGAKGETGATGPTGPAGRNAALTCKVTGKGRRAVRCSLSSTAPARLTRDGRVYARGTIRSLRAAKRLPRGRYTLRSGVLKVPVIIR